jgi:hypothetical protein
VENVVDVDVTVLRQQMQMQTGIVAILTLVEVSAGVVVGEIPVGLLVGINKLI